ncbi:hypothetical protein ERO13_A08G010200v2 [Gossypium hirsutum]|uniref:dihydropyrimidinase n=1 Tax=Gossypium hirsutum TaxID=3635 RepID=A0A1U8MNA4_GOSHI|nr:dihydropyrimidinase isoform X2 [Gossypium hirsutum]KAG4185911.1 hypothetical protein ERO13_A08G010200v2 [Gossypium hirsutum]
MAISQIISLFLLHLLLPLASISLSQSSHQLICEVGTGNGGSIGGTSPLPASLSKLLIKGGTVVNAHRQERADVYVEDGIIVAVKPNIKVGDEVTVLDATGRYVMPGIKSFKFFMAYKGTFMVDDAVLLRGMKRCKSLGALAMVHAENGDAVFEGQKRMIERGITGPEGHALSRPPMLEAEATGRAIRLASFVNTPLYVVHVMSIDAMEEIAKARKTGQKVIGEPVVSGLVLDDSKLWDPDFITAAKYVMSPPIRESGHNKALQAALSTGVLQLVGTDHCTFNSSQKAFGIDDFRKIPNGVNGIEERMHLVWDTMVESGQISVTDFVRITSTECARIFNIYPRKGAILVGSDADIIIFNPNSSFEINPRSHHSRTNTNVYEGRKGKGKVEVTISRGRIVWKDDELKVAPGSGKYIPMPPFGFLFDGIEKIDAKLVSSFKAPVHRFKSDV